MFDHDVIDRGRRRPARIFASAVIGIVAVLAASCSSSPSAPSSATVARSQSSVSTAPEPVCPVPDSGDCLGRLAAGTHTSTDFAPKLTFRMPAGWANYLDVSGLYLLQPPGAVPPGNYIKGSFIGLATRVAPEANDCQSPLGNVGTSPAAIAAWMRRQPGLVTSPPQPVAIGGLRGETLTISMAKGAKGCVAVGAPTAAVPLLVGVGPSSFDHEVGPGIAERDYLLAYRSGTLGIEVIDASGGGQLANYSKLVEGFRFGRR